MAIKSGRVGVRPDQVDEYGRVVASDYLVEQLKEVLPPQGELIPLNVNLNGTYTPPQGIGYGPVKVNVPFDVDSMALGLKPVGPISLTADNVVAFAFTHKDITRLSCPNVVQIEEGAFSYCTQLTNISSTGSLTSLGNAAFSNCIRLTSVSMSAVQTIGNECFSQCRDLASASFSHATSIGTNAFEGCSNLSTVNMPMLSSIGASAFKGCSLLESFTNSNVSVLNTETFYNCSSLESVNMSNVSIIGRTAFYGCTHLTSVNLPNATSIDYQSFYHCDALQTLNLPNVTKSLNSYAFQSSGLKIIVLPKFVGTANVGTVFGKAPSLEKVDIGGADSDRVLGQQAFLQDRNFNTLIIRFTSSVVPLGNINVFSDTPFASGGSGGTLYVPSALISSYQSASNWSTVLGYANNSIQAIEGSAYENAYADGTPINS